MKLSTKYILFVSLVIIALIILSIPFIETDPKIFIAVEILIILSILFSFLLYRSLIRPVKLISSGIETIKGKDFSSKLNLVEQKEMDQLIEVYNRMIDQLRNERILHQEQNFFLDKLITASPSGILIMDFDNRIVAVNPACEKLLGVRSDDILNKKFDQIDKIPFAGLSYLADGETKIIKLSGINILRAQKSHFINRGSKQHFILIEELTSEIRRAEKQSYGKIIRMMSHEINNSIGAINSILNSFLTYTPQLNPEDINDYENAINVAIQRNNKLNRFMGNFADVVRIPQPAKTRCNLNKLIKDVVLLMSPICSNKNINLKLKENENIITQLDVQQFEQVLVNIIKNSIESIIENGNIEVELNINEQIEIIIRDDGKGIETEIQEQLFTPFYSTKRNGQGIGLTLIREILVNHDCDFSLETNSDGLTEFKIFISNHILSP
jgi:nitrogen fixation/metabolism regulation signal transduction histidine kinase